MNKVLAHVARASALLLILSFLVQASPAQEIVDRVVAVVNDDIITLSEVREMALSLNPTSTQAINERDVLDQMIEQKLFEQEATKRGISVSEQELDASIEGVKLRYNLNDEQMKEVLKKQGLTTEAFREQWRAQTLGNKLLEAQLKNKIVVTDDEIKTYYEQNYSGTNTGRAAGAEVEEVRLAHILISTDTPDAAQIAGEVASLAKSGEDFGLLAEQYSDDKLSADKGGDLGYFKKGDLIETLEAAVDSTPVGGVSGPVESPAGYHIMKVLERTEPYFDTGADGEVVAIDDATKEEIRQNLLREKAQSQLKEWLDSVKENAYIENKY